MKVGKVSFMQNQNFTSNKKSEKQAKTPEEIKDGKKKLALILGVMAVGAAAGVAIYKGKSAKLSQIEFRNGIAFKKTQAVIDNSRPFSPIGAVYTGTIKDKLPNGDKITMKYVDGILQKSTRKGSVNFDKVYETINGEKIVKEKIDGVTKEINITKMRNNAFDDPDFIDIPEKYFSSTGTPDFIDIPEKYFSSTGTPDLSDLIDPIISDAPSMPDVHRTPIIKWNLDDPISYSINHDRLPIHVNEDHSMYILEPVPYTSPFALNKPKTLGASAIQQLAETNPVIYNSLM